MTSPRKFIVLLRRPRGMTPPDFHEQWLVEGMAAAAAGGAGVTGYVKNHTRSGAYRATEPPFDGYAEIWRDDDGPTALSSLERSCAAVTLPVDVFVIRDGDVPEGAVKSIELIRRRHDLPRAEFGRYWRQHHGPLACAIPFLRYEQNHLAADVANAMPFDGAAITWFHSTDEMRATVGTPAYERTRADELSFLALPSAVLLTDTHVLLTRA